MTKGGRSQGGRTKGGRSQGGRIECIRNSIRTFITISFENIVDDFRKNGSNMTRNRLGMPPEHSQTLLGHFWEKSFFNKKYVACC